MFDRFKLNFTSNIEDLENPRTIFYLLLLAISYPITQYIAWFGLNNQILPDLQRGFLLVMFVLVLPGITFLENTELLFDLFQIGIVLTMFGLGLMGIFYQNVGVIHTSPMAISTAVFVASLYVTVVTGGGWALKYKLSGTSGIDSEYKLP